MNGFGILIIKDNFGVLHAGVTIRININMSLMLAQLNKKQVCNQRPFQGTPLLCQSSAIMSTKPRILGDKWRLLG